jgi:DNA repair protein RadD
VIDHSGAVHRHGFVEDPVERRLEPDRLAENPTHAARGKNGSKSRLLDCTRCGALRVGGEACRHCGFKPSPPAKFVATVDADLALVKRNDEVLKPIPSPEEKYRWLRELTAIAPERGYKPGWVAHNTARNSATGHHLTPPFPCLRRVKSGAGCGRE